MAITRREFITRLSTLAAAMGVSQVDLAKITEALAHGGASGAWVGGWTVKPKVVWVHGAECTGCSTSLLSLFEDVRGKAIEGTTISTLTALDLVAGGTGNGAAVLSASAGHPFGHRTLANTAAQQARGPEELGHSSPRSYGSTVRNALVAQRRS